MVETIAVEVIRSTDLTEEEWCELQQLEEEIEKAFYRAGKALKTIRAKKLYRATAKTFEEYCQRRFGLSRRQPYYLMDAAEVVDNLSQKCEPLVHIFPNSERQCRPLARLEREQQKEAWLRAVDKAGGVPSGRVVKDVVEQIEQAIRRRAKIPIPFKANEVYQIMVKGNPELKGLNGCWCIVREINEFSLSVSVKGKNYLVRPNNLKSTDLDSQQQQEYRQVCERIDALYSKCADEPMAIAALDHWFSAKRYWLTPTEEKMLRVLEEDQSIGFLRG